MPEAAAALKWGVERRLEFIEFRLYWEGGVNRSDIIEAFDVSVPQASKDLTLYQERAPRNAIYDKSAKRYIASNEFQPCFLKPDAGQYLNQLRSVAEGILASSESWIAHSPLCRTACAGPWGQQRYVANSACGDPPKPGSRDQISIALQR